jgi:hypothetical protein
MSSTFLLELTPRTCLWRGVDKIDLIINNLKTAKQIGLTIPPEMLARASKLIK